MRVLCFFGSGISKPSGLPMTKDITDALFSGNWHKETKGYAGLEGLFRPVPEGTSPSGIAAASAAKNFLHQLKAHASAYLALRDGGEVNYEHLFVLAEVVKHDLMNARLHPESGDFVDRLSAATESLWKPIGACSRSRTRNDQLVTLAADAIGLINEVVRHQLERAPQCATNGQPKGFQALSSLIADSVTFKHIDLVTLNHDLLLESVLKDVDYCDGFKPDGSELESYADSAFSAEQRINLLKPHGSINWYLFREDSITPNGDRYGRLKLGQDPWHIRKANGAIFENRGGLPFFLTGTDKLSRYSTGIFAKQVSWFRRFLEKTERVICSGYGWKDEGMSNLILEWLDSAPTNRLVLLHDCRKIKTDLLQNPHCPWSYRYRELKNSGQLKIIPKWLCDCSAAEILAKL